MNSIINAEGVTKVYYNRTATMFKKHKHYALNDVSISIAKGQTLGIVGESGSGKSTLAKIITAIEAPTSGTVSYLGKTIAAMSASERQNYRREVQIVFQDSTSSLNPKKRIGWLLEEPLVIHRRYHSRIDRQAKVSQTLLAVGLDDSFKRRFPHELSGGQRQRINIALAIILEPTVIIADEPVSALDVSVQAQILNLLKDLQCDQGLTYIFISHDLAIVYYMSDEIAVMREGRIVEYDASEKIYHNPKQAYTKRLFAARHFI